MKAFVKSVGEKSQGTGNDVKIKLKPFIKWVGGKSQILKHLLNRVPQDYNCYFEPFLGGGVLFLNLRPEKAILNDYNAQLINAWKIVQKHPKKLFVQLDKLQKSYLKNKDKGYQHNFYDSKRSSYNDLFIENNYKKNLEKSIYQCALFIFLNKTGFNGLYRVNATGKFNVPWNHAPKVNLYDKKNIEQISQFLQDKQIDFYNQDFAQILEKAQKNDFIYLDPPYDLLNKNSFVNYTKNKFLGKEQTDLADIFKKLDQKGCLVMLSNHQTKEVEKLYSGFHIEIIHAKRMINCKGDKRGAVAEVLITNYAK